MGGHDNLPCLILNETFLQFQRGAFSLMGSVDPESFDTLHSFANAFQMPFVTPWFPEKSSGKSPESG